MDEEEEKDHADSLSDPHSDAASENHNSPASSSLQDAISSEQHLEFRFRKTGQTFAIFYDPDFHVRQVEKIITEHEAKV